jgi:hypothetical protein
MIFIHSPEMPFLMFSSLTLVGSTGSEDAAEFNNTTLKKDFFRKRYDIYIMVIIITVHQFQSPSDKEHLAY